MRRTVLSVAYPFAPVGPDTCGGAEQVLRSLDRALVACGDTSLVVACEGSQVAGKHMPIRLPRPLTEGDAITDEDRAWCSRQVQAALDRALAMHDVDLIHLHGMNFQEYRLPPGVPTLVTLHMPIDWYTADASAWTRRGLQFCCVSEAQRRMAPPELRRCAVVENGVALPPFLPGGPRENYAVMMGRICPEKNAADGLRAGTLAGTPVMLAGQVFPYREHQDYMAEQVEPLLGRDPVGHKLVGSLGPAERHRLLSRARCLLHPTLAPETSSLVAMEALAAGTPVIAYRSGALPEIVEDGVTGFLVDDVAQIAEAMRAVHTLATEACRRAAEVRFSEERMVAGYFQLYDKLLAGSAAQKLYA